MSISIIIPSQNDLDELKICLNKINDQTLLPDEVIIIDSSTDYKILNYLENKKINFYRFNLILKKINKSFAGKSINIGINLSQKKYIGFLDTKTYPEKN